MKKLAVLALAIISVACCAFGEVNKTEKLFSEKTEARSIRVYGEFNNFVHTVSFSQMQEDVSTLAYLLKTSYIGYGHAAGNTFDLGQVCGNIENSFSEKAQIDCREFAGVIEQEFSPYIEDAHFTVEHYNYAARLLQHTGVYFSDLYVKKRDGAFYFCEDDKFPALAHKEYTGGEQNLFLYPSKGEGVYRIGALSSSKIDSLEITDGGTLLTIPLRAENPVEQKNMFRFGSKETAQTSYLSLTSFEFPGQNDSRRKASELMLKKMEEAIKQSKKKRNIIVDVRGNPGGLESIANDFSWNILYKNDFNIQAKYKISDTYFSEYIESPAIGRAAYINARRLFGEADERTAEIKARLDESLQNSCVEGFRKEYFYRWQKNGRPMQNHFRGNIYIIADRNTMSAAELFYAMLLLRADDASRIKLIGENTFGGLQNSSAWGYQLPHSGIILGLCSATLRPTLERLPEWHGEGKGKGFFPDYWTTGDDLLETLVTVTGDPELRGVLSNIYYGLQ